MFCCIGKKVKWLAKLILWLGSAISIIGGVLMLVLGGETYRVPAGIAIIVLGLLISWSVSWVDYAIGVAADAVDRRLP